MKNQYGCEVAASNLRKAINPNRRFPQNVFVGDLSNFLFFDADWMRDADFVDHVKAFLDVENGTCACLANLDRQTGGAESHAMFFIDEATTLTAYRERLMGPGPGKGWLENMSRLACASDTGEWAMYCEPVSEIAVVGFRGLESSERYRQPAARLRVTRFDEAMREPVHSYGFSNRALSETWRDEFLREYAVRFR